MYVAKVVGMGMVCVRASSKGYSLVEMLIASSIGLLVLAVVTTVFLPGFSMLSQRSLQLMLAQDTNDALRMMKEDLLRAGFASGASSSFVISGATKIVHLDSPIAGKATCIGYGFDDGMEQHYRSYYLKDNKLNVFMTKSSQMTVAGTCKNGHSVLDSALLKVTRFEVVEKVLSAGSSTSQYLTINLDVGTLDGAVSVTKRVTVKTRNWN